VNYVAITPVKDEERFIEETLVSMTRQSLKPIQWIIVDDSSSDRTPEIIQRYADQHSFIKLVRNPKRHARETGVAEVLAFNVGNEIAQKLDFDLIVKLDGDLSFEEDYFAGLVAEFEHDSELGIASGVYMELHGTDDWKVVPMPAYHAAGASKLIRRECFEQISGFITQRGWDTIDEIRAIARGWKTTHFPHLRMKHLKPEGTGMGLLHTAFMHGEIYYRSGGSKRFFILKVAGRLLHKPYIIAGLKMFGGYFAAFRAKRELLVTQTEARCYQKLLNQRIAAKFKLSR
jgi:glycosyltransferase involved in cell wall biosynthesis